MPDAPADSRGRRASGPARPYAYLPADTTPDADRVYFEALRRLGPTGRLRLTFQLHDRLRALARAGVKYRHPDYSEEEVRLAVARLMLGRVLFERVYPGREIAP